MREMLLEALEAALISAYKRNYGGDANVVIAMDRDTGEYKIYHRRTVVDQVEDPKLEKQRAGYYHDHSWSTGEIILVILLLIFLFPIGVIVLIVLLLSD